MPDWLFFVLFMFVGVVVFGFLEWIGLKLFDKRGPDESRDKDTLPFPLWVGASYAAASLIVCGVSFFTKNDYVIWAMVPLVGMFYLCVYRTRRRQRERENLGLCFECGYNLRGLTELRCPECNTPFEKCSAKS